MFLILAITGSNSRVKLYSVAIFNGFIRRVISNAQVFYSTRVALGPVLSGADCRLPSCSIGVTCS